MISPEIDLSSFLVKLRGRRLALALVRDLRDHRAPVSEEDLADFETDVLAGFVLARRRGWPTPRSAMTPATWS